MRLKGGKGVSVFGRVWLVLWKNFILRKRLFVVTGFEIILPTLFACLLAYMRTRIVGEEDSTEMPWTESPISRFREEATLFQIRTESDMISMYSMTYDYRGYECEYAFTPDNPITRRITDEIEMMLNRTMFNPDCPECHRTCTWIGMANEKEIEAYAEFATIGKSIKGAIIFEKGFDTDILKPGNLAYKIRKVTRGYNSFDTDMVYPWFAPPGPDFGHASLYYYDGFLGFQILVDKAIMKAINNFQGEVPYDYKSQAFPYPEYPTFDFNQLYVFILPQFLIIGYIFIVPSIMRTVVAEKESGIKELMKMMGLPSWVHWFSWMLNSLTVAILTNTIIIAVFFIPFSSKAGAVLIYGDLTLWWFVLLLYSISITSFCFCITTFFDRPTLATTFGIVIYLISYYGAAIPSESKYQDLTLSTKMCIALIPNMALSYALRIMSGFEGNSVGAKWGNLFSSFNATDTLTLGHVCIMFIVNTILFMMLTLYFENVIPTKYGIRKPWYYIFMISEWTKSKQKGVGHQKESAHLQDRGPAFEQEPLGLKAGIEIHGLKKSFKSKQAVDNVSLNIYENQITALLGHNGAGKTTTISILTGMYSATEGKAFVNGYSIESDMVKVRESLGLCPQHNMLFDKLTVLEHLMFFGRLKGMSSAEAKQEAEILISKLQINEKKDVLSMSLSGGQKRKLSLGCAFIGKNKVVILDEPTSGMDPEARRAMWDLLMNLRQGKTILLTTHFMEEADVLGDRIAIMADGKLQCSGTPMFLKKHYGTGYTLRMTLENGGFGKNILGIVKKNIPSASINNQFSHNATELNITIPFENNPSASFSSMFSQLSSVKNNYGIQNIGLSVTTMDEVFIKVGEISHKADDNEEIAESDDDSRIKLQRMEKSTGMKLAFEQFLAIFLKKALYSMRKWKLLVGQLIFPVLLCIAAILIGNVLISPSRPAKARKMTLSDYRSPVVPYNNLYNKELMDKYSEIVGSPGQAVGEDIEDFLLKFAIDNEGIFRERYIAAAQADSFSKNITTLFSTLPQHTAPLSLNLATNAILKLLYPDYSLEVTNHPMMVGLELGNAYYEPSFVTDVPVLFMVMMPIGLAILAATFVVLPIEEKICQSKQLQNMTGISPIIYWGASFLWDFLIFTVLVAIMVACFPIFQKFSIYDSNGGLGVCFLVFWTFGFGGIAFSYLLSLSGVSIAGRFSLIVIVHILTGMGFGLAVSVMDSEYNMRAGFNAFQWIGRFFPAFGVSRSSELYVQKAAHNGQCNILSDTILNLVCQKYENMYLQAYQYCCSNCKELLADDPYGYQCHETKPYMTWTDEFNVTVYDPITNKSREVLLVNAGIAQEIFWTLFFGLLYILLLGLVEYGLIAKIKSRIFKEEQANFPTNSSNDSDVGAEINRTKTLIAEGRQGEEALIISNFSKSFGSFAAVSNVSFGVHHGECFGLLGVNGAGKTTSFRLLTGDETPSFGEAFMNNLTLTKNRKELLASVGYCPQFDGIIGVLNGREMLSLFASLRGVPRYRNNYEVDRWLKKTGLYKARNVLCRNYSGGMKRRLSAAMAMIGDPAIILLDEPTSGVDPAARRQFWKVITSVKNTGQAIILTSHSMEECEVLCSRLGIMVNGEVQCIGGTQHLKNKFAQGYSLMVKLKQNEEPTSERFIALNNWILHNFSPCELKDHHQNSLQFHINNIEIPWEALFGKMEGIKEQFSSLIEDYSISETSLEEVFLSFARKQYPERRANISTFRKILTCHCFK